MSRTVEYPNIKSEVKDSQTLTGKPVLNRVVLSEGDNPEPVRQQEASPKAAKGNKVCMISSSRNALEQRMFLKEATSLARTGYCVSIIAPHPRDEVVSGISIRAATKFESRLSRMIRTTWYVYREALRQKAQVYHFHNTELMPVGWLLKLQGKRVFYDVREDTPADIRDRFYIPRYARPVVANAVDIAEKFSGRFLDGIIAATDHIGARFLTAKTAMSRIFPCWTNLPPSLFPIFSAKPWSCTLEPSPRFAGFSNWLMPWDCCPLNFRPGSPLGVRLIRRPWKQKRGKKQVGNGTDHAGWQNRQGLLDLLGKARIGVVPFLPAANHTDCQPTKLFEYMVAGLPVVATDLLQVGKIVRDAQCGILVEPGNPKAMANAIQWLLEHPREAQEMGDRGRR